MLRLSTLCEGRTPFDDTGQHAPSALVDAAHFPFNTTLLPLVKPLIILPFLARLDLHYFQYFLAIIAAE
jgi:hypothetical protein